jgi:hypothetical protein
LQRCFRLKLPIRHFAHRDIERIIDRGVGV